VNQAVDILATLTRVTGENGIDVFCGTIDLSKLRKAKVSEVDVVMVPLDGVPKTLATLIRKASDNKPDLLLFASSAEPQKSNSR
jgi:hypothetical protein